MTLVYPQGDFEAFLTAILETWVHKAPEWEIVPESGDWFGPEGPRKLIHADASAARRMAEGVVTHSGEEAWRTLTEAFRHADRGNEALLAEFIRLCVRLGPRVLEHLAHPGVRDTVRRARAVRSEAHRFLGLVRFQEVAGGGWYARFEPDHDVLGLLVGHFHQRMEGLNWMLHDQGRQKAWVCRGGVGQGVSGVNVPFVPTGEVEPAAQELWRLYFKTIAIPGRTNLALQRSKMPLKTWKNLVEKG